MEEKKSNNRKMTKITSTSEEGFNLSNCFEGKFEDMYGFNYGTDAYFNCYSHFGIH